MLKIFTVSSLFFISASAFATDASVCINKMDRVAENFNEQETGKFSSVDQQLDLWVVVDKGNQITEMKVTFVMEDGNTYRIEATAGCKITSIVKK